MCCAVRKILRQNEYRAINELCFDQVSDLLPSAPVSVHVLPLQKSINSSEQVIILRITEKTFWSITNNRDSLWRKILRQKWNTLLVTSL